MSITTKTEVEFLCEAALLLAYEAGRWHGEVDLEEHYDRQQYTQVMAEAVNSRKTSSPADLASNGRTVRINLRSDEWREGVKKSAGEYLSKAIKLLNESQADKRCA